MASGLTIIAVLILVFAAAVVLVRRETAADGTRQCPHCGHALPVCDAPRCPACGEST